MPVFTDPEEEFDRSQIPATRFFSDTDISLTQTPTLDIEDPILYRELLKLYDAIEALQIQSDRNDQEHTAFVNKDHRRTTTDENYTVKETDGTIRVDASASSIIVTLYAIGDEKGNKHQIKRIDTNSSNKVTLLGDGTELIDGRVGGIVISCKSSYTVQSHDDGWDII